MAVCKTPATVRFPECDAQLVAALRVFDTRSFFPVEQMISPAGRMQADFAAATQSAWTAPHTSVEVGLMRADIARLYATYDLTHLLDSVRIKTDQLSPQTRWESYALALAHLSVFATTAPAESVKRDAVFVCARHLRSDFTRIAKKLVALGTWQSAVSPGLVGLLQTYLSILKNEYNNVLPPIW
ncbi:MAG: hypothetical protein RLZZ297_957 [Chloroflexota bacterium]|jgi:hypothetical protein